MRSFEVFEHTSDLGIIARGDSLEETLAGLCEGVFSLVASPSEVRREKRWVIKSRGDDLEEAAVRLLNEALFVHETEGALFSRFDVAVRAGPDGVDLEARLEGEPYDPGRHRPFRYIKAATYHCVSVRPHEARMVFDV
ncbi:MAG: archease [Ignavibacteriales bacterium]